MTDTDEARLMTNLKYVPSGPAVTPPGAVGDRIAELRQALHADKEREW